MKVWPVQDAKARFSELLDASVKDGPQVITRRGVETAVLVPIEEWRERAKYTGKTAKDLLLHDPRRFEIDLPERGTMFKGRQIPDFD